MEASAGAGKTTFISKRIINHIKRGADPAGFVFIAFSNEAATELYRKIEKNIRREFGKITEEEKVRLDYALHHLADMKIMTMVRFCYALMIEAGEDPGVASEFEIFDAASMSLKHRELIKKTRRLLESNDEFLKHCREIYSYIYVDEFQDTDEDQAAIIFKLAGDDNGGIRDGALFILGDEKQSIYRAEGADVNVFRRVREYIRSLPGAQVMNVTGNYRTEVTILDWVNETFKDRFDNYIPMDGEWEVKDKNSFHGIKTVRKPKTCAEDCGGPNGFYDRDEDKKLFVKLLDRLLNSPDFYIEEKDGGLPRKIDVSDLLVIVSREESMEEYADAARKAGADGIKILTTKRAKGLSGNITVIADRSLTPEEYFGKEAPDPEDKKEWLRFGYVNATRARHALIFMPEIAPGAMFSEESFKLDKQDEIGL